MPNAIFAGIRHCVHAGWRTRGSDTRRDSRFLQAAVVTGGVSVIVALAACVRPVVISMDTAMPATLDVSPFSRVLVAGFIGGGSDEIDANVETTRLLKSQLRHGSKLRVVEASGALLLFDIAGQNRADATRWGITPAGVRARTLSRMVKIPKSEGELKVHEAIFSNVAFWKRIGEEYQQPIIVTGTVLFTTENRITFVAEERETFDRVGQRHLQSNSVSVDQTVYTLKARFVFIDGRTGTILHSETFREEAMSAATDRVPALSAYFHLMDRIVPGLLATFTTHTVYSERALLK